MTPSSSSKMFYSACLFILFSTKLAFAANFATPKDTMEAMIQAAKEVDIHLWATCLSSLDKKLYQATVGKYREQEILKEKGRREAEFGTKLGADAFEFMMFRPVLDYVSPSYRRFDEIAAHMFDLSYVKQELIWDDKYAEVTVIIPALGKGLTPPMTFFFIKEDSKWKLFEWMTVRLMLGWLAIEDDVDYNDNVNFMLYAHTRLAVDRRNCVSLTRREFGLPLATAEAYREVLEKVNGFYRAELFSLWLVSGDVNAEKAWEAEKARSANKDISNPALKHLHFIDSIARCLPDQDTPDSRKKRLTYDTAENWYKAAYLDVIAQKRLIEKFPKDRMWCSKAQLLIAQRIAYDGSPDLAIMEYEKLLREYPEFPEEATSAKIEMAKLLWEQPNQQGKAIEIWKDLKTAGKLPKDSPYYNKLPVVSRIILDEPKIGYGINDFNFDGQGHMYLLRVNPPEKKVQSSQEQAFRVTTPTSLEMYDLEGNRLKTLSHHVFEYRLDDEPAEDELVHVGNGIYFSFHNSIGKLNMEGKVELELYNKYDGFVDNTSRQINDRLTVDSNRTAHGYVVAQDSFEALYCDSIRSFSYNGDRISTIPVDNGNNCDVRKLRKSRKGTYAFIRPANRMAIIIDKLGKQTKITDMHQPWSPADLAWDNSDNLYIYDAAHRCLLKYDSYGKLHANVDLSQHFKSGVSRMRFDGKGNIYFLTGDHQSNKIVRFNLSDLF